MLEAGGFRLGILALTDYQSDYAAAAAQPSVAYANLPCGGVPDWVADAIAALDADAILVTPHWEWNMTAEPVAHVRAAARGLLEASATLVAGHSAHVFHGIALRVLYDLGDSSTTNRVDRQSRNDLGVLCLVHFVEQPSRGDPAEARVRAHASPTVKTPPGSGAGSATPTRRSERP